jgi:hypothetical protein
MQSVYAEFILAHALQLTNPVKPVKNKLEVKIWVPASNGHISPCSQLGSDIALCITPSLPAPTILNPQVAPVPTGM